MTDEAYMREALRLAGECIRRDPAERDRACPKKGPPQSRSLALWGEEGQRNERAFAAGGSEGYGACPDDVPVGCVVVSPEGRIIGRGRNRREELGRATAHAEVEAINEACAALGTWRLEGCRLYVTLEPCPMCAGAIINARVAEIYFGAREKKSGCCGSVLNLFCEPFNHHPRVYGPLLEGECRALLEDFFRALREGEGRGNFPA